MKKITTVILAAALMISMVSCAETAEGGTDAEDIVVTRPVDTVVKDDPSSAEDPEVIEKLTPATTEAQDFIKKDHSYYSFFTKGKAYDTETRTRYYFEGMIEDSTDRRRLYDMLCTILGRSELTIKKEQDVIEDGEPFLTIKAADGAQYSISRGILVDDIKEDDGNIIYVFKAPNSRLYFEPSYNEREHLEDLLNESVIYEKNIVGIEPDTPKPQIAEDTKPELPLAYIKLRSNFAWGTHVGGSFIDANGVMFTFDLSDSLELVEGRSLAEKVCNAAAGGIGKIECTGVALDKDLLEKGLSFAGKIPDEPEYIEEYKMCDYGQESIYVVVDGKPVMLNSYGDVDKFSNDKYIVKTIECYKEALNNAMGYKNEQ